MDKKQNQYEYLLNRDVVRSLAIALGVLSKNIDITTIKIPKACNSTCYAFKSHDGEFDETMTFAHKKNEFHFGALANERQILVDILNYMYIDELKLGYTPLKDEINKKIDDYNAEIAERLSEVIQGTMYNTLNQTVDDALTEISNHTNEIDEYYYNSDKPSRELHATSGAGDLIDKINYDLTHHDQFNWSPDNILDIVHDGCARAERVHHTDSLSPSYDTYTDQLSSTEIDQQLEKEKARLVLIAMLGSQYLHSGIARVEQYSNQLMLKIVKPDGTELFLNLDRPIGDSNKLRERQKEIATFKSAMYRQIYDQITGTKVKQYPPDDVLEMSVYSNILDIKNSDPLKVMALFDGLIDIRSNANFNHDEILLKAIILQAMAILGKGKEHLPNLKDEMKTPKNIKPKLDALYDLAQSEQECQKNSNGNKKPTTLSDIYKELNTEASARKKCFGMSGFGFPINFNLDDIYFKNGMETTFYDVIIKNNVLADTIDVAKDHLKSSTSGSSAALVRYMTILLMQMINVASRLQQDIKLIDDNSTKLTKPDDSISMSVNEFIESVKEKLGVDDILDGFNPDDYTGNDDYNDDEDNPFNMGNE